MYSNGYAPPTPPVERRRRSERNGPPTGAEKPAAAPAAMSQAASSSQVWQQPVQGYPSQRADVQRQMRSGPSRQQTQAAPASPSWTAGAQPAPSPMSRSSASQRMQAMPTSHAQAGLNPPYAQGVPLQAQPQARPGIHESTGAQKPVMPAPANHPMGRQDYRQGMNAPDAAAWTGTNRPISAGGAAQGYGQGGYPPQQQPLMTDSWQRSQARFDQDGQQPGWQQQGYPNTQQPGWQMPPPPIPPAKQGGPGGRNPRNHGRGLLIAFIMLLIAAGLGVGGYYGWQNYQTRQYVEAYDTLFCQGVYVDGIHLGGMTQEEGINAVTLQAQQRSDSWSVRLTYQGQLVTEITADQLGMTVDVIDTLREAWSQGHTGDLYQRQADMQQLLAEPFEGYTALPGGDTSAIDSILLDISNKVYRAPQDAAIIEFDPSKTNPFTFQEEVLGRILDTDPIKETLYRMVSTLESGDIEIAPEIIQPEVTVADLQKQVALRGTATTDISTTSTENRTNNIRRCFELITGYILQPGSTFSFNEVVGQRTVSNGFYEADEYVSGQVVTGIGGGSCQASTTLYQAAVRAGMEITEREPHSMQVNYCDYGMDATVYWYSNHKIDLAFRNPTDSPIYIVAAVQSNPSNRKRLVATVSIYGADLGDITYELVAVQTETLPAPTEPKYVKDTKQQYVTYTDEEQVVTKAKDGLVVVSYRVTCQNGVEISREFLFSDRYEPKQETIYVGVKNRET